MDSKKFMGPAANIVYTVLSLLFEHYIVGGKLENLFQLALTWLRQFRIAHARKCLFRHLFLVMEFNDDKRYIPNLRIDLF